MLEEVVAQKYEELKAQVPGFCGCPLCRDDVLVYALNRLPPRYVAQRKGEVFSSVAMGSRQPKADISVVLLDGFRRVMAGPRPEHEGASNP